MKIYWDSIPRKIFRLSDHDKLEQMREESVNSLYKELFIKMASIQAPKLSPEQIEEKLKSYLEKNGWNLGEAKQALLADIDETFRI